MNHNTFTTKPWKKSPRAKRRCRRSTTQQRERRARKENKHRKVQAERKRHWTGTIKELFSRFMFGLSLPNKKEYEVIMAEDTPEPKKLGKKARKLLAKKKAEKIAKQNAEKQESASKEYQESLVKPASAPKGDKNKSRSRKAPARKD